MSTSDPMALYSAAITQPPNSEEQFLSLRALRQSLEVVPARIPMLLSTLISGLRNERGHSTMLRSWVLDVLAFALSRSGLSWDVKAQVGANAMDVLGSLLGDPDVATAKQVISCFAALYPVIFRSICTSRQPTARAQWEAMTDAKNKIREIYADENASVGLKLAAIKFLHRVILVQSKGVSDPRLLNRSNDISAAVIPTDHPFLNTVNLENEGIAILRDIVGLIISSKNPDLLSAAVNGCGALIASRPSTHQVMCLALTSWTPDLLVAAGVPSLAIKGVEKCIRLVLVHMQRNPQAQQYSQQIGTYLQAQQSRMETAAIEEKERRNKKRALPEPDAFTKEAKRPKLDKTLLSSMNLRSLPSQLAVELIVAGLSAITEADLNQVVQTRREAKKLARASGAAGPSSRIPNGPVLPQEPFDPLKMDMDDQEFDADALNSRLDSEQPGYGNADDGMDVDFSLIRFDLPPPRRMTDSERSKLVMRVRERLYPKSETVDMAGEEMDIEELKSLLVVRMVTRGFEVGIEDAEKGDKQLSQFSPESVRQAMCDYVVKDLGSRTHFANVWMNEEWYNDQIQRKRNPDWVSRYDRWLLKIVEGYNTQLTGKDKTLQAFLLDLPDLPAEIMQMLGELCLDPDRMQIGFPTLRDIVTLRPRLRTMAMRTLLELTTHPEKLTRTAAINTVRRWVPDAQPMDKMTRQFAIQILRRLQTTTSAGNEDEDGQLPQEAPLQTPYLSVPPKIPAEKPEVLQHVELLFALSIKAPEMLEELFTAYVTMDESIQEAVQELITALIRPMGSSNPSLLTMLRHFPTGSESLVLRVVTILTTGTRPSAALVALIKTLVAERNLGFNFIIPIIGEMDKVDILRHLPRIVATLDGTPERKAAVKSIFMQIVQAPPETFGNVTSNMPRVRQSELLTPAELMKSIHHMDKDVSLKSCIEAITVCFQMTDVFRSEILAVVMQQMVDEPTIPTLFLRTVIQAVTTYKSLVGFVSTTLLSRLVTKKIWTDQRLWEGFIMCAKKIAPASFGALLQLPREQLRDLVDKQPQLKVSLRDFVIKKSGNNKAKLAGFLEIFGEEPPTQGGSSTSTPVPSTPPGVAGEPPRGMSPAPTPPLPPVAVSPPTAA